MNTISIRSHNNTGVHVIYERKHGVNCNNINYFSSYPFANLRRLANAVVGRENSSMILDNKNV